MSHLTNAKFILNLSLWNTTPDIRTTNASKNISCTHWSTLREESESFFFFFLTIAPLVCVMGIVGNALGLMITFREKCYTNVLLTRSLYVANIFNCFVMFIYPIMDMLGEYKLLKFWFKLPWNTYMANYHFPVAKSLVTFSFGIYVILALSQMIGTTFPFKYKIWFRAKNIWYMLIFNFIYVVVWYIPTTWWFEVNSRINMCEAKPLMTIYYFKFR
ncbi:unnamed protein product [Gordionus sp. m RMFG-2023]